MAADDMASLSCGSDPNWSEMAVASVLPNSVGTAPICVEGCGYAGCF